MSGKALIIVPTFNESENLPTLVAAIMHLNEPVDLLVIDDNSPDGTGEVADRLAEEWKDRIFVIHRAGKLGLGRAYCTGFLWALERDYAYVIQMDGDLSHDPGDVGKFLRAIGEADLVIGSRYTHGIRVINWPLKRLMLSLAAARYVRVVTGLPVTDPTSGFKCFRSTALASIDLHRVRSNGYSFQIEMNHILWRKGMRIVEVPIIFTDRYHGTSKMSGRIVREALVMVWRLLLQNRLHRSPRIHKHCLHDQGHLNGQTKTKTQA